MVASYLIKAVMIGFSDIMMNEVVFDLKGAYI